MTSPRPLHLRVLFAWFALLAPAAGGLAQSPEQSVDAVLAAHELEGGGPEALAARLAALGPAAAGAIITRIETARADRRRGLLLGLAELPADAVSIALRQRAESAGTVEERASLLGVLRHVGRSQDLTVCLTLADPRDVDPLGAARLQAELRGAMTALLRRERPSAYTVQRIVAQADPELFMSVVGATQGLAPAVRSRILSNLIGRRSGLDAFLLQEIAATSEAGSFYVDPEHFAAARRLLSSSDEELVQLAAHAAAATQDEASIEPLVALLGARNEAVREAALRALRTLTRLEFSGDQRRWSHWLALEHRWYEERAEAALIDLGADDRSRVMAALREIGMHRLARHELAYEVAGLIDHPDDEIVLHTIAVLRALGSVRAAGALVDALSYDSHAIATAAQECLVHITGRQVPSDPHSWREVLQID